MKSQQQAERAEQQRIKNLVLNYDLNDDQHDGEEPAFHYALSPNGTRVRLVGKGKLNTSLPPPVLKRGGHTQRQTSSNGRRDSGTPVPTISSSNPTPTSPDSLADNTGHIEHPHAQPRQDKSGNTRSKQRARKLQMGDIDWYGRRNSRALSDAPPPAQASLDDFVKKRQPRQREGFSIAKHDTKKPG